MSDGHHIHLQLGLPALFIREEGKTYIYWYSDNQEQKCSTIHTHTKINLYVMANAQAVSQKKIF